MKTVILTVDNTRFMDSFESSYITVTSPTGGSIRIYKAGVSHCTDKAQVKLFKKLLGDPMNPQKGIKVKVTVEEMRELLKLSQL